MINNTETRTSQNDKVDTRLPIETYEAPADTLTDDGSSANTLTFERECDPIYPFRFWCQPDAPKDPPSDGDETKFDTHIDEPLTIDGQTPETEFLDTIPDPF